MKLLVLFALLGAALAYPQAGLVGPSGSIGPSGMVGPSGPVQFHQPAWAFLGHAAHAHVAALNRVRAPAHHAAVAAARYEPAPVQAVYGIDGAGCLVGPGGKVCPTGNVQFT